MRGRKPLVDSPTEEMVFSWPALILRKAIVCVACSIVLTVFSLLSRRGIVLSDFSVLERLRRIRHVCLDKTGTVTRWLPPRQWREARSPCWPTR